MEHKTKAQMMWEISKEQEKEFRKGIPDIVNGINTWEFFKLIRGAEYRRGKEDGNKELYDYYFRKFKKSTIRT